MPRTRPLERELALMLGHRLQRLRTDAGLSQERVAQLAGISRNHYQLLERGLSDRKKDTPSNPTLTTLLDVSAALDSPLTEILADFIAQRTSAVVPFPAPTGPVPQVQAAARTAPAARTVRKPDRP